MNDAVKKRTRVFLNELGVTVTKFCKNANLSVSTFHKWNSGTLVLSKERLKSISDYLSKYNF